MTQQAQDPNKPLPFGEKLFELTYEQTIRGVIRLSAQNAADASDMFGLDDPGQIALKVTNIREV